MFENKKVYIFDLDGTVIDSVNMYNEIYANVIKEITGKKVTADQIQDEWNYFANKKSREDLYDCFLKYLDEKYCKDKHELKYLKPIKKKYLHKALTEEIKYKKYAKEVINKLKEKECKLVLATISPKKILDIYNNENKSLSKDFKIYDVFDLILSYDDVKEKKPSPEVYIKAVEKIGVSKDECLIIEDSLEGIKAARNAGIDVVNVVDKNMYKTQKEIDKLCDYKFNDLSELYKFIK